MCNTHISRIVLNLFRHLYSKNGKSIVCSGSHSAKKQFMNWRSVDPSPGGQFTNSKDVLYLEQSFVFCCCCAVSRSCEKVGFVPAISHFIVVYNIFIACNDHNGCTFFLCCSFAFKKINGLHYMSVQTIYNVCGFYVISKTVWSSFSVVQRILFIFVVNLVETVENVDGLKYMYDSFN